MDNFEYFGGLKSAAWTIKDISRRMGFEYKSRVEQESWNDGNKTGETIIDKVFDGSKEIMELRSCYNNVPGSKILPLAGTSVYFSNEARELLRRARISMTMQERKKRNN